MSMESNLDKPIWHITVDVKARYEGVCQREDGEEYNGKGLHIVRNFKIDTNIKPFLSPNGWKIHRTIYDDILFSITELCFEDNILKIYECDACTKSTSFEYLTYSTGNIKFFSIKLYNIRVDFSNDMIGSETDSVEISD